MYIPIVVPIETKIIVIIHAMLCILSRGMILLYLNIHRPSSPDHRRYAAMVSIFFVSIMGNTFFLSAMKKAPATKSISSNIWVTIPPGIL